MSFYLQIGSGGASIQIASNKGYGDFGRWVESLGLKDFPQVKHLYEFGWSQKPVALKMQLDMALKRHPPSDPTIVSTARGLSDSLQGISMVVSITDGLGPNK